MATPLKLKDANGNIQELTTTEENYIAYQVGLHLSTADSAEVGSLNRATTGATVGTYSNTFFNQAVGTHPSTSISTGTTNTVIYQTTGTAAETDSDVFRPIMWVDSGSQTGFKMMPDVDLNAAVDRYLGKIFTNEYPGSYRLSTSAPSGDWAEQQTAFIDTRTDGASIAHKLWKRTGGTAPTAVKPMRLKNEASFAGVQEMSDAEIKFSFGQRAKTRVAASKIGSYQLRNSSQGAPTDTGTWVAKGTATDTKNTTANQAFTRDSTVNFSASYSQSYTQSYATNFTSISNVNYTSTYTRVFDQGYSIDYTGGFNQGYTSTFSGTFSQNYDTQYTTQYTNNFTRFFPETYVRNFSNNFTRNTDVTYTRDFTLAYGANYIGNYLSNFANSFAGVYLREFAGFFATNADYVGNFTGGQYISQTAPPNGYSQFFSRLSEVGYAGPRTFVGSGTTSSYLRQLYYSGSSRNLFYQRVSGGGGQGYTGNQGTDSGPTQNTDEYVRTIQTNYLRGYTNFRTYQRNRVTTYSRTTVYVGNFQNSYTSIYDSTFANNFSNFRNVQYNRQYAGGYTTNYVGNYQREFGGFYTRIYEGNYQREFSQSYTTSYTTGYIRAYDGAVYTSTYDRAFTAVYTTSYEGAFDAAYTTAYEGNYEQIYDKSFDTSYITDYLGNFQGNFEGETIQSANATNETYTLYVRIS